MTDVESNRWGYSNILGGAWVTKFEVLDDVDATVFMEHPVLGHVEARFSNEFLGIQVEGSNEYEIGWDNPDNNRIMRFLCEDPVAVAASEMSSTKLSEMWNQIHEMYDVPMYHTSRFSRAPVCQWRSDYNWEIIRQLPDLEPVVVYVSYQLAVDDPGHP